ncbi:MAG TPA: protein kinase [Polyangiaceae bacterium]
MARPFALPNVGDLLAEKYRVLRVIADGGMGVVFEAHHELLGKNVALKFPLPELAHVPSIAERFLAEARLCARIENEHVVRVLDVSKIDGLPYIVMELVSGMSLASQLGTPSSPARAAAFTVQVLDGLDAVHALGIVHRDIKPENVLIVETSRGPILKLIDFGIAKDSIAREAMRRLTHAGAMLGTPAYMAPEQIRDPSHAGSSVDLYSAGILLFEMLAGVSPFRGDTVEALTTQALAGQLRTLTELVPATPPELAAIVRRATALDVADRFANAAEFRTALLPFAANAPATPLKTQLADASETQTSTRTEPGEPPSMSYAVAPHSATPEPRRTELFTPEQFSPPAPGFTPAPPFAGAPYLAPAPLAPNAVAPGANRTRATSAAPSCAGKRSARHSLSTQLVTVAEALLLRMLALSTLPLSAMRSSHTTWRASPSVLQARRREASSASASLTASAGADFGATTTCASTCLADTARPASGGGASVSSGAMLVIGGALKISAGAFVSF